MNSHARAIVAAVFLMLMGSMAFGQTTRPAPTTRPFPAIKRVMVISVDGLRPDLALRADTPTMHSLMDAGAFTFWAQTTEISITLPSHVSMLTGVMPKKHKIDWNAEVPAGRDPYPAVPTLFELAKANGYSTGLSTGKSKFTTFAKPGVLDWSFITELPKTDDKMVATKACDIIEAHQPQVMFIHFPGVDSAGHGKGWASPEQMAAIHDVDGYIGQIIATAKKAGTFDETLLIVTADHGGQGRVHGPNDPRSRHIPWIVAGPGVRANYDLTRIAELHVNTEDTFATACYVLGIPLPADIDGKPVLAIFQQPDELLVGSPKTNGKR